MKILKIILVLIFSNSLMAISEDFNLQKGTTVTDNNMSQLASTSIQYALARHQIKDTGDNGVQAFLETPEKKLYSLSRSGKVYLSDMETEDYLGNWSLKTEVCGEDAEECDSPWWDGRWGDQEFLEPEVRRLAEIYPMSLSSVGKNLGCLNNNHLRYGDIESDGVKELIVTLNDNLVVFNVNKNVASFISLISVNDWETAENTQELYAENTSDIDPQYVSFNQISTATTSKISSLDKDPGMRGYAKHYFGHFSTVDANEVLVWRKLYRSLLEKDPRRGFEKISDSYAHYKLVDGEYKKQLTSPDTIKSWLAEKNLTWQKGYPSKSECPGQEGQLIPEMHDPLLNDPDVLK